MSIEDRISHLKRSFGSRRTRIRRLAGAQTWDDVMASVRVSYDGRPKICRPPRSSGVGSVISQPTDQVVGAGHTSTCR
ncbi:hypothetical protein [Wenjunlia tyrosinilytica]|uniref:Uncharacterized protein n=1 Tax=Wenjunlia tyrosinilytica TaxID=1544741 RepID=A0A917ZXS0_9ACTN|nr:hypothetical protein GCM10012280_65680 [Wenjunlia tyrosinilytica]